MKRPHTLSSLAAASCAIAVACSTFAARAGETGAGAPPSAPPAAPPAAPPGAPPAAPPGAPPAAPPDDFRSRGEFGAYFGISPGIAGEARNPGVQITPGISFAVGRTARYHLSLGFSHMIGANGIDIRPAGIGLPIHITSTPDFGFAIEPLIDVIGAQAYFGGGAALFLLSSGIGVQAIMNFKHAFVTLAPLNFQFQYLVAGTGNGFALAGGGFGMNMPIRLSGGLRF